MGLHEPRMQEAPIRGLPKVKLTAIGMVKDEADVIERTLRHLLDQGVDEILLLENASTDGTWEIVRDLRDAGLPLIVYPDAEVGYFQSRKMSNLAQVAYSRRADWIIPFDADELWTAPGRLRSYLEIVPESVGVLEFPNHNHYRTDADPGGHPFDAMVWRSADPLPLGKVAFRAGDGGAIVGAGNHDVLRVPGRRAPAALAMIHHYPYRSEEQFIRKARNGSAAYAATDLPRSTGLHWREWGETLETHGEDGLRTWYREAFTFRNPLASGLVLDPVGSLR